MKRSIQFLSVLFFWLCFSGQVCTKVMVYGKDYNSKPYSAIFGNERAEIMRSIQKTLENLGYEIININEESGNFITGWKPVEADSHYFNLFGRKDYGVSDGAYYRITVDLVDQGSKTKVLVATTVKGIAGKLQTTNKVEKRIMQRMEDHLRTPQIEMTNVGIKNK